MNILLPPAMNASYRGPRLVARIVALLGVAEILPALIHAFAPDGGAFSIARLPPGAGRETIVSVFAWAGATQLVWGLVILGAGLRYRVFLPPILALLLIEKSVIALNGWLLKGPALSAHHPPGLWVVLALLPLLAVLLAAAARHGAGPSAASPERTP